MTDRVVEFKLGGTLAFRFDEPSRAGAIVSLFYDGFRVTARGEDMSYVLPSDKAVKVKVSYVDAKGNPAEVDGPVTWASADEGIATVAAETDDGSIAMLTPGDMIGQTQISATADVDLGEGVRNLVTTMDLEVVAGEAVAGVIEPVGAPVPIP